MNSNVVLIKCPVCGESSFKKLDDTTCKCHICSSTFFITPTEISEQLNIALTYREMYKFSRSDDIYQNIMDKTSDEKIQVMCNFGRLLSYFGITYIKDFDGRYTITYSKYDPEYKSIKECTYYKHISESKYMYLYQEKLDLLDVEYKRIKDELAKTPLYDVFICTKISLRTKHNLQLKGFTEDSQYAFQFYKELKDKGLKVFYSQEVLSGIDFDAQIYSALMRSKNILVITTEKDYLESAWVQSEWRRWINFINTGVKNKNSLFLFIPNGVHLELPIVLEKTQKFNNTLELVNRMTEQILPKKVNTTSIEVLLRKANTNILLGKFDDATEILSGLCIDYPEDYRPWLGLVDLLVKQKVPSGDEKYIDYITLAKSLCEDETKQKAISSKYDKYLIEEKKSDVLDDSIYSRQTSNEYDREYTLSFDTDGGSRIGPSLLLSGSLIKAPQNPTKAEYQFVRWEPELPELMPSKNLRVKAIWETKKYSVTFNTNGGSPIEPQYLERGEKIILPSNPTKRNSTFVKWDKEVPLQMGDKDLVFNAIWRLDSVSISFNTKGGNIIPSIIQEVGTKVNKPQDPIRTGYTFIGWDQSFPSVMGDEDLILTANWKINEYYIHFDTDGGSEMKPLKVVFGKEVPQPKSPIKDNYAFIKWVPGLPEVMPDHDVTVRAEWMINLNDTAVYELNYDGESYSAVGIKFETDRIFIKSEHHGLPVTRIAEKAFFGNKLVKNVVLTGNLKSIGESAFSNCINLESIEIPNTVKTIDNNAFSGCSNLTQVKLSDSLTEISASLFYNCSSLKEVVLPESITKVSASAFFNCFGIKKLTFSKELRGIGSYAFSGCSNIENVYYNGTLDNWANIKFYSIVSNPMYYAKHLFTKIDNKYQEVDKIELTSLITEIGEYQFCGIENVKLISVSDAATRIGASAFQGCVNVEELTVPFVGTINEYQRDATLGNIFGCSNFELPKSLKKITITKAKWINQYALNKCYYLETINLPDTLVAIEDFAFAECWNITELNIPNKVTFIGDSAFMGCSSLTKITLPVLSTIDKRAGETYLYPFGYFFGSTNGYNTVACDQYILATNDALMISATYHLPQSLKTIVFNGEIIRQRALLNIVTVNNIELLDGVKKIEKQAFENCTSLTSINIPQSVIEIEKNAFYNCYNLTIKTSLHDKPDTWSMSWNKTKCLVRWNHKI